MANAHNKEMNKEEDRNILIGRNVKTEYNHSILIGDNLIGTEDHEILVGDTLMGEPVPKYFRDMVENYPISVTFLLENTLGLLGKLMTAVNDNLQQTLDEFE